MDDFYIERIIDGDADAFNYLVNQYTDLAFSIAFRIVKNTEDAEEIVQDSFMKVYKYIKNFRRDSKFSTWLYKIVYNTAITKSNKNLKSSSLSYDDNLEVNNDMVSVASNIASLKKEEQKKFINLALDKLNEIDSLLLSLYYLSENTIEEIEEITGFSKSNIKTRMHRARKKMYEELVLILKNECPTNLL
jgi:RNA polymerase sigma-70 factor (ECF subfamily)